MLVPVPPPPPPPLAPAGPKPVFGPLPPVVVVVSLLPEEVVPLPVRDPVLDTPPLVTPPVLPETRLSTVVPEVAPVPDLVLPVGP